MYKTTDYDKAYQSYDDRFKKRWGYDPRKPTGKLTSRIKNEVRKILRREQTVCSPTASELACKYNVSYVEMSDFIQEVNNERY